MSLISKRHQMGRPIGPCRGAGIHRPQATRKACSLYNSRQHGVQGVAPHRDARTELATQVINLRAKILDVGFLVADKKSKVHHVGIDGITTATYARVVVAARFLCCG